MKKIILIVVTAIFMSGCSENVTGQKRHRPDHHNDKKIERNPV